MFDLFGILLSFVFDSSTFLCCHVTFNPLLIPVYFANRQRYNWLSAKKFPTSTKDRRSSDCAPHASGERFVEKEKYPRPVTLPEDNSRSELCGSLFLFFTHHKNS